MKTALLLASLTGSAIAERNEFCSNVATHTSRPLPEQTPTSILLSMGIDTETQNQYTSHNGVEHLYVRQLIGGVPVQNAVGQFNVKNGKILSFTHSFVSGEPPAKAATMMFPGKAKEGCMHFLGASSSDCADNVEPELRYVQNEEGVVELAWRVECDLGDNWMESYVSAETGAVISQIDYFHEAGSGTYSAYAVPDVDPGLANNVPQVINSPHVEAFPSEASTLGWHDQGDGKTFTTTIGNNVYAQEGSGNNFMTNYRPDGGSALEFNYTYDHAKEPKENMDASVTNLFYLNNLQHDIFYGYGFDEVSGNFQENNLGRGGKDGDAVQANAQDSGGTNNANFATPADGQRPRMNMYIWTGFSPARDGDLDAGIVFHEYGHGISNRLTGGPANSGCLTGVKQGAGMGEGWSDFFGKIIALKPSDDRTDAFPMGDWIAGEGGIRNYPYSTDMDVNPLTFGSLNSNPYGNSVHAAGTVWCTALWDAMWDMVDVHGFDEDVRASGQGGNNKMLQLVVDGLKMQPCRPTMLEARDAIILADEADYDGEHYCLLWSAFARRGFGSKASAPSGFFGKYEEDFSVPSSC